MKQFAIAINSEKEYEKVKAYAEKWGYDVSGSDYNVTRNFVTLFSNVIRSCNGHNFDKVIEFTDKWRKAIRKHSPLKLENICVRIDTVERVKEVWGIIKDCGKGINQTTISKMEVGNTNNLTHLNFNNNKFHRTNLLHKGKTEITAKQLAQILGVKREKSTVCKLNLNPKVNDTGDGIVFDVTPVKDWNIKTLGESVESIFSEVQRVNERIDKLAKNYKITESDSLVTRKELKEYNSKLRNRIYDIENYIDKSVNPILAESVKYNTPKTLTDKYIKPIIETSGSVLPKIAIRVENEQEFNDLMKIYEVLGWVWQSGNRIKQKDTLSSKTPMNISFKDYFSYSFTEDSYTIIPFSQIKGLK